MIIKNMDGDENLIKSVLQKCKTFLFERIIEFIMMIMMMVIIYLSSFKKKIKIILYQVSRNLSVSGFDSSVRRFSSSKLWMERNFRTNGTSLSG